MMTNVLKAFALLLLVAASAGIGFYYGFGYGAKTLGAIATQAKVGDTLGEISSSITDLEKNDLAYSQRRQQYRLYFALNDLGLIYGHLEYWQCSDRDRHTIRTARDYVASHPRPPIDAAMYKIISPGIAAALQFCQDKSHYERADAD
jgi:cysteinyl-tRNA synthetase